MTTEEPANPAAARDLPTQTDVLIVGAGPTGLALAVELSRRGCPHLLIDAQAEGANTSRAAVVHARTLEVLEAGGATEALLAEGVKVPFFRVRDRDRLLLTVDFREIPSRYQFTLMCPQNRTEAILLGRLRHFGGDVFRPASVRGLETAPDRTIVMIESDGVQRQVAARWVVGCDGMHSSVREAAGIGFEGSSYQNSFVLADVAMDWPLPRDEVDLYFSPDGLVVVAPLPGDRFRIVATVDEAPEHPSIEYVQSLIDARGPEHRRGVVTGSDWSGRFRVHHRVATSPRRGRVLLCGDAAHVHSPAGGQGMNTGIQDAVSLAEPLIAALGGQDAGALDRWADERHEVAVGVVSLTDRMTRAATVRNPLGRSVRNAILALAGSVPAITGAAARRIAELED